MDSVHHRNTNNGGLRGRVESRRARTRRFESVLDTLETLSPNAVKGLTPARRSRRHTLGSLLGALLPAAPPENSAGVGGWSGLYPARPRRPSRWRRFWQAILPTEPESARAHRAGMPLAGSPYSPGPYPHNAPTHSAHSLNTQPRSAPPYAAESRAWGAPPPSNAYNPPAYGGGYRTSRPAPAKPPRFSLPIPGKLVEFLVVMAAVAILAFVIIPKNLPSANRSASAAAASAAAASSGDSSGEASSEAIASVSGAIASVAVAGAIPAPEAVPVAQPEGLVRIMVLGSDRRGEDAGFRTDVMLLVTIDPASGQVSMLSFPRDLVGNIPGYGDSRINVVMGMGGFEMLQGTLQDSYGVRPDYYFLTNFDGFVGMINSIGGITIEASQPLEDSCDLPQSRAGICTIEPGRHEMDGATALWYVRSRKSSSDFDRLRRAQEVIAGVFARFMGSGAITRLPELYAQYSQDVETNMGLPQMLGLLPTAIRVASDTSRVQRFAITHDITADWVMPDGAAVQLPDYEAVKALVRQASFEE